MKLPQNSLTIGYVHGGSHKDEFFRSLWDFRIVDAANYNLWTDTDLIGAKGLYVDNNRNDVINNFMLRTNKEAFLFIDDDMSFEPDALYMLVDELDPIDKPIISGFYGAWRKGNLFPEWWDYDEELGFVPTRTFKGSEGILQKLDGCGMGFCLIHRSVFERFPILDGDPWRWFGRDLGLFEGKLRRLDEDITFCKRTKFDLKPSIPIYGHCHTGLKIKHLKESPVNFQTWLDQMKIKGK